MSELMIRCPATKHRIATGIEMERAEFVATKKMGGSVECPECGKTHYWTKDQAELVTSIRP